MSTYDNYFTNGDKPFAENLNDALLLSNVFDLTVPVEMPRMFKNGEWIDTTNPRKCGVCIVTFQESLPNGIIVNGDELSGSGTIQLGFYPNFNSFGKIKSITWEHTGSIIVNLKTKTGTTIASNINNGIISSDSEQLRKLQEIIIEIVFDNATLSNLRVVMENKNQERYGAEVGITDVTGLDNRLTNIEAKDTQQDSRLTVLESNDAQFYNYEMFASNYNPLIDSNVHIKCKCTDITGNRISGKTLTLQKNGEVIGDAVTDENGIAKWTLPCDEWGIIDYSVAGVHTQVNVDGWRRVVGDASSTYKIYRNKTHARLVLSGWRTTALQSTWRQFGGEDYASVCPPMNLANGISTDGVVVFYVNTVGGIYYKATTSDAGNVRNIDAQFEWAIQNGY